VRYISRHQRLLAARTKMPREMVVAEIDGAFTIETINDR
jgi:hypothetical protein